MFVNEAWETIERKSLTEMMMWRRGVSWRVVKEVVESVIVVWRGCLRTSAGRESLSVR